MKVRARVEPDRRAPQTEAEIQTHTAPGTVGERECTAGHTEPKIENLAPRF